MIHCLLHGVGSIGEGCGSCSIGGRCGACHQILQELLTGDVVKLRQILADQRADNVGHGGTLRIADTAEVQTGQCHGILILEVILAVEEVLGDIHLVDGRILPVPETGQVDLLTDIGCAQHRLTDHAIGGQGDGGDGDAEIIGVVPQQGILKLCGGTADLLCQGLGIGEGEEHAVAVEAQQLVDIDTVEQGDIGFFVAFVGDDLVSIPEHMDGVLIQQHGPLAERQAVPNCLGVAHGVCHNMLQGALCLFQICPGKHIPIETDRDGSIGAELIGGDQGVQPDTTDAGERFNDKIGSTIAVHLLRVDGDIGLGPGFRQQLLVVTHHLPVLIGVLAVLHQLMVFLLPGCHKLIVGIGLFAAVFPNSDFVGTAQFPQSALVGVAGEAETNVTDVALIHTFGQMEGANLFAGVSIFVCGPFPVDFILLRGLVDRRFSEFTEKFINFFSRKEHFILNGKLIERPDAVDPALAVLQH